MTQIYRFMAGAMLLTITVSASAQPFVGQAPDIGMGKKRAAVCFACHGTDGIAQMAAVPHLAGQDRAYLEKALHAYREGQSRQDPTMTAMAKPLSDRDIVNIAAYFSLQSRMNNGQTAAQELESIERIRPLAKVASPEAPPASAALASPPAPRSGAAVYQGACAVCHMTGAAGAPKLGDAAAWAARIAKGTDTLIKNAIHGFQAMPPKGGCAICTDDEIKAVVEYLVAQSK